MKFYVSQGNVKAGRYVGKLIRKGKVSSVIEELRELENCKVKKKLLISVACWFIRNGYFRDGLDVLENIDKEERKKLIKGKYLKHFYKAKAKDDIEAMALLRYTQASLSKEKRLKIEERLLNAVS